MRICPDDTIGGVSLVAVRDTLRPVAGRQFTAGRFEDRLGLDPDAAAALCQTLADAGYLEPADDLDDDGPWWQLTLAGGALTNATAARPVRRATAQKAFDGLLERAEQVNADPDLAYRVDRLILFGSFLDPDADPVGDVDVAVELTPRATDPDEHLERMRARAAEAAADGRTFATFTAELTWGYTEVMRRLKGRSRVLSLTDADDGILDHADHQVVYRRDPAG